MEQLEQRLRQTLDFYLAKLPDNESRDFMIKLIIRDCRKEIHESCRQEMYDVVSAFYYGEDLSDPEIMEFYKEMREDLLNDLK